MILSADIFTAFDSLLVTLRRLLLSTQMLAVCFNTCAHFTVASLVFLAKIPEAYSQYDLVSSVRLLSSRRWVSAFAPASVSIEKVQCHMELVISCEILH
jgi:hypothetical protein